MKEKTIRLAGEVGGTFTDIILLEKNNNSITLKTKKIPSTPKNPEKGLLNGFDKLDVNWEMVLEVLHGSTVGTNAVLERKGVKTSLIITEGFRDILEIQRGDKENIYDLFYVRTPPIVTRDFVFPVRERISDKGEVIIPINSEEIKRICSIIKKEKVDSVAICFLHSYKNPINEISVKKILEDLLPNIFILTSSEILPQFREYERTSTTVISSYIAPIMSSYVNNLQKELFNRGFKGRLFITQSNGGILPAEAIKREVVRTLLSGPAAGVTGAIYISKQNKIDNIITLDMGGTSTDVCLVTAGKPIINSENSLNGLPIAIPTIDICSVGAGGGSLANIDKWGMLKVGPQSAGADPGPACYGRGGQGVTVTDALVFRGLISVDNFVGGEFELNAKASEIVLDKLSKKCKMSKLQLAEAIDKITINNMMRAVRIVSTERGNDPRSYSLVAFGGAGPLHAVKLAEELGISQVIIPRHSGLISAFGLLVADVVRDYVKTDVSPLEQLNRNDIFSAFENLKKYANEEFKKYGFRDEDLLFFLSGDLRYIGQAFELNVPIPNNIIIKDIIKSFNDLHQQRYGHSSPNEEVEIINYRLQTTVIKKSENIIFANRKSFKKANNIKEIYINGKLEKCNFVSRDNLEINDVIEGISIIEESTSTCFVPRGWFAKVLDNYSLSINRK
jgi:N-methylhydantoinase A/acetone carboxylase, beta subunit